MPTIHLTTFIQAPVERVFDLSRSIDLHKKTMAHTKEEAVSGCTAGLIGLDETVTWKARHLGKTRILKSKITQMKIPQTFTDEMVSGDFRKMHHEHHFKAVQNGTLMIDYMHYEVPYGWVGKLADTLLLRRYMNRLLERRNASLKKIAESELWKQFIY
ncbi:SRPBCC family protein [Flavihumibacter solisilvae]|jgi:ligand-binding SRPBCC domain-containing protein|uniref:Cell division protein n=1 Tax=Flavihumibacter solisilvae TaxID=1349421 RepID=A0A0C1L8P0_9BACT|nr:SRPBCC family protein [Flavihumibacter solisilvae]KIC96522.1 cell division protein [Flavihumibacter solisilvae]